MPELTLQYWFLFPISIVISRMAVNLLIPAAVVEVVIADRFPPDVLKRPWRTFSYIRIEGNVPKLNAIDGIGRDFDSVVIER